MSEIRDHPSPLGAGQDKVEAAYRRERRAFWWTCGWAVTATFSYVVQILALLWGKQRASTMPTTDPNGFRPLDFLPVPSIIVVITSYLLLISSIAFLICLMRWLLAMRRRRLANANQFFSHEP